jgi:tetratricopeptide (TPR) repeat protein
MEDEQLHRLLRQGIAAARAGDRTQARDLLLQVIDRDEEVEAAWLWLSGVVDDLEGRQICLENVLTINPNNAAAQAGLRYLAEQAADTPPAQARPPAPLDAEPRRPVLKAVPDGPASLAEQPTPFASQAIDRSPQPALPSPPPCPAVEIDPFGCPYCGGPVSSDEPRCDHCRRPVALRSRKRSAGSSLAWLVLSFILLGVASWGEGYFAAQLVAIGHLPAWLTSTAVRFLVGAALFSPAGLPGESVRFADTFVLVNTALAVLCLIAALGLAFRFRAVYLGAFLLAGFVVAGTGAGLLTQLIGWVPALFRLGLVALAVKWLVENAPAFEWETRYYDADVDHDLHTDLDYYSHGLRYYELGMWAKAAAHWKVATQLAASRTQYRVALANAYVKMGYPAAALAEADKALVRDPKDQDLHAFRDSLASAMLEESP